MTAPIACVVDGDRIVWKCTSHECPHVATREMYWPGHTAKKCNGCFDNFKRVAKVMGFELQSKELDVPSVGDDATVRFAMMELV